MIWYNIVIVKDKNRMHYRKKALREESFYLAV